MSFHTFTYYFYYMSVPLTIIKIRVSRSQRDRFARFLQLDDDTGGLRIVCGHCGNKEIRPR